MVKSPILSRVIVIFQNETTAKKIFEFLTKELAKFDDHYSYIKIHLQENLLQKSKSSDNLHDCQNEKLNVTKSLNNFRNFHNDPKMNSLVNMWNQNLLNLMYIMIWLIWE